jgi:hypothetical protein
MPTKLTPEIINAAIVGFDQQKLRIDTQIAELRAMLYGGSTKPTPATTPEPPTTKRRKFSASARRRMKEAQQRRWAKIRGESERPAPATSKPKRRLSKARKAALVANLAKARAARAAKRAEAAKAEQAANKKAAAKKTATKKTAKKIAPIKKAAARAKKVTAPTETVAQTA